jgi:hypothetical protein
LAPRYPALKLYFMGTRHPNPVVTGMSMPEKAIQLSRELGLFEKAVFFGDWTRYEERGNYLAEADLAVVSHPGHIETRFSFRTRVLDCIWAGLPILTTEGDAMADWVKQESLGLTVPPGDVDAMAQAIEKMMLQPGGRAAYAAAFQNLQVALQWPNAIRSLAYFCRAPSKAPDAGVYLTEIERMSQAKDEFLTQVVREKDEFLAQVIREKDDYYGQVIREKDAVIEHYRNLLPLRVYRGLKHLIGRS